MAPEVVPSAPQGPAGQWASGDAAAQPQETVVARLRPHARSLFWPSVAFLVLVGATAYAASMVREPWQNTAVLAAGALAILLLWVLPLLSWLGRNYTITTRRIVLRSGLLIRVRQELLHSRGYDLVVRQNALQSLFRSGDIYINTGLEHPIVLRDVPGVDLVQAALSDLMEQSANSVASRRQQEQSRLGDGSPSWQDR
jgi:membrane protein YdbS with pleckstrin-like domain